MSITNYEIHCFEPNPNAIKELKAEIDELKK